MDALRILADEPLDETSRTPLYRQLKHRILRLMATGAIDDATPLPTEHALCEALGISRSTVRRCFGELVDEGYVIRRRGRGTFMAREGGAGNLDTLYLQASTSSTIERSGARSRSRVLKAHAIPAAPAIARRLDLAPGERVWEVSRLRLADDLPVSHEVAYLPCHLCPDLDQKDFNRSIYEYIAESSGALAVRTEESIDAVVLDRMEARLLGTIAGAAALRIAATSFDTLDRPFEASVGIARADRFCIRAHYGSDGARIEKVVS